MFYERFVSRAVASSPQSMRTLVNLARPTKWHHSVSERAARVLYHLSLDPATHARFAPYFEALIELSLLQDPVLQHVISVIRATTVVLTSSVAR
jgi:hypothetical protein